MSVWLLQDLESRTFANIAIRSFGADSIIVDPWFNFRATKYLVQNGFYSFWDWFDDRKMPFPCYSPRNQFDHLQAVWATKTF